MQANCNKWRRAKERKEAKRMKTPHQNKAMQEHSENKAIEAMDLCFHVKSTNYYSKDYDVSMEICDHCGEQL